MELTGYSLNMPKWLTHTVEVYLYEGGYRATLSFDVSGSSKGMDVISSALSNLDVWEFQKENVKFGDADCGHEGFVDQLYLINDNGDKLSIGFDDGIDISKMVIGVRIVAWEEERE